jgi:hypothetical protein
MSWVMLNLNSFWCVGYYVGGDWFGVLKYRSIERAAMAVNYLNGGLGASDVFIKRFLREGL